MSPLMVATVVVACAVITAAAWVPILRWLPEPDDGAAHAKVPYAALATWPHALIAGGWAAVSAYALTRGPTTGLAAGLALATVGTILGLIDACTTWLPLRLTHVLWALTILGVAVTTARAGWPVGLRAVLAAALTGGFLYAFWWFFGGLGFGDVRLAPVLGAVAGAASWPHAAVALLAGTALGAAWGMVRLVRLEPGPFPYGPSLIAGVWVAYALL